MLFAIGKSSAAEAAAAGAGPAAGKNHVFSVSGVQHHVPAPDQVEEGDDDAESQNVVARFVEILCVGKKLLA